MEKNGLKKYIYEILKKSEDALEYKFSRSSGAGGQSVNKSNSKVQLFFNINNSSFLDSEKEKIIKKVNNSQIIIESQEERSQMQNRSSSIEKLIEIILEALLILKERKESKVSRSQKHKRLENKKKNSRKKESRKFSLKDDSNLL